MHRAKKAFLERESLFPIYNEDLKLTTDNRASSIQKIYGIQFKIHNERRRGAARERYEARRRHRQNAATRKAFTGLV